jgi:hypothetical protein
VRAAQLCRDLPEQPAALLRTLIVVRWRVWFAAIAVGAGLVGRARPARADDDESSSTAHSRARAGADGEASSLVERGALHREPDGPLLHLDTALSVRTEGVGADGHEEIQAVELGLRLRAVTSARWWQAGLSPGPLGPGAAELSGARDLDVAARGWRLAGELSYDLGLFRIGASVATGRVDGRGESGSYSDVAVSISRGFQLSRGVRGWISVSAGLRRWSNRPPPGESDGATVLLSVGGTWQ